MVNQLIEDAQKEDVQQEGGKKDEDAKIKQEDTEEQ